MLKEIGIIRIIGWRMEGGGRTEIIIIKIIRLAHGNGKKLGGCFFERNWKTPRSA